MADNLAHPYNRRRVLTIDDLPDDDLLAIFDFYVFRYQYLDYRQFYEYAMQREIESWHSLVQVCRRWRGLVFGSPRRLNLQLSYILGTTSRKSLDVWPALPLLISGHLDGRRVDNVIDALEHRDRIRQIDLGCDTTTLQVENLWIAMQVPFPELAVLRLTCFYPNAPVLTDSFLGGSAPHLRYFDLNSVPFPGLPKLLLSATHLVDLHLHNIPLSGYISPQAMATGLSMLTSLETLRVEFGSPQSYPDLKNRRPFPPARSVLLPSLTNFSFQGENEYLEEFVARIDAPQLCSLSITFFNDVDFKTPELNQFISRVPTLGAYDEAYLVFGDGGAFFRLCLFQSELSDDRMVQVRIPCKVLDQQLSTLAQICTLSLRLLLTIKNLYIDEFIRSLPLGWMDDLENTNLKWLGLLLSFTAAKNLYISRQFSPRIARVLQELTGGKITEVLPALQNVFLEGFQPSEPVQGGIAQFISARQLTDHPVTISVWHRNYVWDYPEASWEADDG